MKGIFLSSLALAVLAIATGVWWRHEPQARPLPTAANAPSPVAQTSAEPIQPIPPAPKLDPAKVALGEKLFHDVRLSRDNATACATCHRLDYAGEDGLPRSRRSGGTMTPMHTPTIFNVSLNFRLFWDGRKKTLEEQIETPRDTQTEWREVRAKLQGNQRYPGAPRGRQGIVRSRQPHQPSHSEPRPDCPAGGMNSRCCYPSWNTAGR